MEQPSNLKLDKDKLKPIFDNVVIEPEMTESTEWGFILPPDDENQKVAPLRTGHIIAVGPGKLSTKTAKFIPTKVKTGQRVAYRNYSFIKYYNKPGESEEVAITPEENVVAIIT